MKIQRFFLMMTMGTAFCLNAEIADDQDAYDMIERMHQDFTTKITTASLVDSVTKVEELRKQLLKRLNCMPASSIQEVNIYIKELSHGDKHVVHAADQLVRQYKFVLGLVNTIKPTTTKAQLADDILKTIAQCGILAAQAKEPLDIARFKFAADEKNRARMIFDELFPVVIDAMKERAFVLFEKKSLFKNAKKSNKRPEGAGLRAKYLESADGDEEEEEEPKLS